MSILFGDVEQLGMVVKDADATMAQLARLGIGPFYVFREVLAGDFKYKGRTSAAPLLTLAFAQTGNLQIEVIQQHNDVDSAYRDFLAEGHEGVQHVSSWQGNADDYDQKYQALIDRGLALAHEGTTVGGLARFAYFTTDVPGGLCVEISEGRVPALQEMMATVAEAAKGWDGRDPIRTFGNDSRG